MAHLFDFSASNAGADTFNGQMDDFSQMFSQFAGAPVNSSFWGTGRTIGTVQYYDSNDGTTTTTSFGLDAYSDYFNPESAIYNLPDPFPWPVSLTNPDAEAMPGSMATVGYTFTNVNLDVSAGDDRGFIRLNDISPATSSLPVNQTILNDSTISVNEYIANQIAAAQLAEALYQDTFLGQSLADYGNIHAEHWQYGAENSPRLILDYTPDASSTMLLQDLFFDRDLDDLLNPDRLQFNYTDNVFGTEDVEIILTDFDDTILNHVGFNAGKLTIRTRDGDDSIMITNSVDFGSSFHTDIYGDAGADQLTIGLIAGTGATLHGGSGDDDLFIFGAIGDLGATIYGDDGDDEIRGWQDGVGNLFGGAGADIIWGGNANDLIYGDGGDDTLNGGDGNDSLRGGDGDDLLLGRVGNDLLSGNSGNDRFYGGYGNDRLFGGTGDDQLNGGSDDDEIHGGLNNDILNGDGGDDRLYGDDGDDVLNGGDGIDRIEAGRGNDTLRGEDGNDLLLGRSGIDVLSGGAGDDRLYGGSSADRLFGGVGNDQMNGGSGDDYLRGGLGNDQLNGNSGDDDMNGEDGNDSLRGGDGNDRVEGGRGNDTLRGDDGNDLLLGRSGTDVLSGGNGDDRFYGGSSADRLFGGAGNDTLNGGSGDDYLSGGAGNDSLKGNSGNDTFVFKTIAGTDTVQDFTDGADLIEYKGGAFADLTIVAAGANVDITAAAGGHFVLLNTDVADITVDDFIF